MHEDAHIKCGRIYLLSSVVRDYCPSPSGISLSYSHVIHNNLIKTLHYGVFP